VKLDITETLITDVLHAQAVKLPIVEQRVQMIAMILSTVVQDIPQKYVTNANLENIY
jgi:hypothetical protein